MYLKIKEKKVVQRENQNSLREKRLPLEDVLDDREKLVYEHDCKDISEEDFDEGKIYLRDSVGLNFSFEVSKQTPIRLGKVLERYSLPRVKYTAEGKLFHRAGEKLTQRLR